MRSHKAFKQTSRMAGLSIIELLVAMALSLFLIGGVVTMFASSRSSYETNDRVARVQENGRFAIDSMMRDVRASGYMGCVSRLAVGKKTTNTLNKPAGLVAIAAYDDYSVTGYNYTSSAVWAPVLDTTAVPSPADGSDVLLMRQPIRGLQPVEIISTMSSPTDDLKITPIATGSGPFRNNQTLMLADCHHRSIFEITAYDAATGIIKHDPSAASAYSLGNSTSDLGNKYEGNDDPSKTNPAQLVGFQTIVYYIRNGTNGNGLWRRVGVGTPEELVEGVDSMQLKFGVDTNGDGIVDNYVDPNAVADPTNIMAVSIALLMRSLDQYGTLTPDTKTYDLLGATFTAPGDRRLRQTFVTTATIRNFAK
jgi:type IV pilus assembly protein PilW